MKDLFGRKNVLYYIGMIAEMVVMAVLRDQPETMIQVMGIIAGLTGAPILAQGGADAFGSDSYHSKRNSKKK